MRLVNAKTKNYDNLPPQERCCEEVVPMQQAFGSVDLVVDLDDTMPYTDIVGHCGQDLGYKSGVKVVKSSIGDVGYVPFEMIDIDEGEGVEIKAI